MNSTGNDGWVKMYRELLDKAIWKCSTAEQKVILVALLLMVNHQQASWEWRGMPYVCSPGQTITSLDSIVEACGKGITVRNVRTALERFEKFGFLTNESTKTGRLITIVNWDVYQGQKKRQGEEADRMTTNGRQSTDKHLSGNKNNQNDQNGKSIEKESKLSFSPPSIEEIRCYCQESNSGVDPEQFHDYYAAHGWLTKAGSPVQDWKAQMRLWKKYQEADRVKEQQKNRNSDGTADTDRQTDQRRRYNDGF